jgi:hypothetical protein
VSASGPHWAIHADAWTEPADVPSLNKQVSDLILQRIEDVRRAGARQDPALTSTSVLLLGPAGAGKTHLFTRLRRQAGRLAAFIHTRPQIGVEPTPRFVLRSILDSLKQPIAGDERMQIDLVVGAILAAHEGDKPRFPLAKVEEARALDETSRRALFERVVEQVEDRFPGILPDFLLRLLAVPFAARQDKRALLGWLSGGEPSAVDLERLGAPGPLPDLDVMAALSALGIAAAYGAPVVLVFDQLENLAEDGGRTARIHAHARLVSDLRDTVRGLVIVQMALDAEWTARIHPALHESDRARLEETVRHLFLPTPDERRELLLRWREALLPEEARAEPFPHPFRPAAVEGWIHDRGMTPRMLMQACAEAYLAGADAAAEGAPPVDPGERLQAQWAALLTRARLEIDEAAQQARGVGAERLSGGLVAAFELLHVEATPVPAKTGPLLRLTHEGASADVVIAQHGHPKSLAAAIRSATTPGKRVILLREHALAIAPTWKEVDRCLAAFTAQPDAAFVPVGREDVARLLALEAFVTAARSHDVSADDGSPIPPAEVLAWVARSCDLTTWGPLTAILASPAAPILPAASPSPVLSASPSLSPPGAAGAQGRPPVMGAARAALERLRVASIERLLREVKATDPTATRAAVVDELRRSKARASDRASDRDGDVRFFGDSIVALDERRP